MDRLFALPDLSSDAPVSGTLSASRLGVLSEHAAISKLLAVGWHVAVPVVDDDGVDLVVNYRHKVQVRGTRATTPNAVNCWVFSYSKRYGYRHDGSRRPRPTQMAADFLLCHAAPIDAWWVVPREWLHEAGLRPDATGFSLNSDPLHRTKYASLSWRCRDAWDLLEP
jgi:hypothetical protein